MMNRQQLLLLQRTSIQTPAGAAALSHRSRSCFHRWMHSDAASAPFRKDNASDVTLVSKKLDGGASVAVNQRKSKNSSRTNSTHEQLISPHLTDTFGRFHNYLRISLTEKCNLRCVYCMPEEGVQLTGRNELLTLAERKRAIELFASMGVTKLRFTGGEPTISSHLEELIRHAKADGCGVRSIGITSNGLVLKERLDRLVDAGLDSVNVSLDTLDEKQFAIITRRSGRGLYRVLSAVHAAVAKGLHVKINCVMFRGLNDHEIKDFIQLTRETPIDVRFIELMPFNGNDWDPKKFISYLEVVERLRAEHGIHLLPYDLEKQRLSQHHRKALSGGRVASVKPLNSNEFDPSDTTKWFKPSTTELLADGDDGSAFSGRVGFITSMSSNFCSTCNRLRLTADGKIKNCLFGKEEFNLRESIRNGMTNEDLAAFIGNAVKKKHAALGGHDSPQAIAVRSSTNRPMILIGG